MQPKSVLVIMDSRGRSFDHRLPHICKYWDLEVNIETLILPAATIDSTAGDILHNLNERMVDLAILSVGVNNLSVKHSNSHITPRYTEVGNIVDIMTDHYTKAKKDLYKASPNVVMGHLKGLSFLDYNKYYDHYYEGYAYDNQQQVVYNAMIYLTQAITLMKTDSGLVAPWIMDTVHTLPMAYATTSINNFMTVFTLRPKLKTYRHVSLSRELEPILNSFSSWSI